MSWEDIMRRVLPPINGVQPHITGPAGKFGAGEAEGRQYPSSLPHGGVDFNYEGGRIGRLNRSNPVLRSPVDGVVDSVGQGTVGRIAIRDKDGFLHEILHSAKQYVARKGDPVTAGQIIGTMGKTGTNDNHVHYQLRDQAGKLIDPTEFWNQRGAIDPNPAPPAFLDQSRRAAEILSGLDEKSSQNGDVPFTPKGRSNTPYGEATVNPFGVATPSLPTAASPTPFIDRYIKFGSAPRPNAPAASDDGANFADRFGNWASAPAGALGNVNAPPQQSASPSLGKRSESPDTVTPTPAEAIVGFAARRLADLSAPVPRDMPPLAPVQPPQLLGIFSGKPMPDYPVRPSIFATDDRSDPDDDELVQRWRRWLDA